MVLGGLEVNLAWSCLGLTGQAPILGGNFGRTVELDVVELQSVAKVLEVLEYVGCSLPGVGNQELDCQSSSAARLVRRCLTDG